MAPFWSARAERSGDPAWLTRTSLRPRPSAGPPVDLLATVDRLSSAPAQKAKAPRAPPKPPRRRPGRRWGSVGALHILRRPPGGFFQLEPVHSPNSRHFLEVRPTHEPPAGDCPFSSSHLAFHIAAMPSVKCEMENEQSAARRSLRFMASTHLQILKVRPTHEPGRLNPVSQLRNPALAAGGTNARERLDRKSVV